MEMSCTALNRGSAAGAWARQFENGHRQGRTRANRASSATPPPETRPPLKSDQSASALTARARTPGPGPSSVLPTMAGMYKTGGGRPRRPPLQESGLRDRRDRGERAELESYPFQPKVPAAQTSPPSFGATPPHTAPAPLLHRKKAYGRPELGFFMVPPTCAPKRPTGAPTQAVRPRREPNQLSIRFSSPSRRLGATLIWRHCPALIVRSLKGREGWRGSAQG
jgi:hypothetical protein